MSNTRTRRRLHSDTRPARRSLVELTAVASRALEDACRPTSAGLPESDLENWVPLFPRAKPERLRRDPVPNHEPDGNCESYSSNGAVAVPPKDPSAASPPTTREQITSPAQHTSPIPTNVAAAARTAASRAGVPAHSDSTAEMIVKIAKDCHNGAFENIKASLNAALSYAKELAEKRAASEVAKDKGATDLGGDFLTIFKGATAEFRADALELMKANAITTLEYARELAGTRTTAEIVELSGTHARKQCELMLKQAGALKSFAQMITKPGAE
jgi:hypothetical protein